MLDAVWAGATPRGLERDQQALYDLCTELHRDRRCRRRRTRARKPTLGEQGTIDAIAICGYYALLAMVLNSPEARMKRLSIAVLTFSRSWPASAQVTVTRFAAEPADHA